MMEHMVKFGAGFAAVLVGLAVGSAVGLLMVVYGEHHDG